MFRVSNATGFVFVGFVSWCSSYIIFKVQVRGVDALLHVTIFTIPCYDIVAKTKHVSAIASRQQKIDTYTCMTFVVLMTFTNTHVYVPAMYCRFKVGP